MGVVVRLLGLRFNFCQHMGRQSGIASGRGTHRNRNRALRGEPSRLLVMPHVDSRLCFLRLSRKRIKQMLSAWPLTYT